MKTYTTGLITGHQADDFIEWFDAEIGTETDTTDHKDGTFSVTCFELKPSEVRKCRYLEENKFNLLKYYTI
jgi:hypothetical protein